jgi:hypothetical protein
MTNNKFSLTHCFHLHISLHISVELGKFLI